MVVSNATGAADFRGACFFNHPIPLCPTVNYFLSHRTFTLYLENNGSEVMIERFSS